jgi:hypothetical protein
MHAIDGDDNNDDTNKIESTQSNAIRDFVFINQAGLFWT